MGMKTTRKVVPRPIKPIKDKEQMREVKRQAQLMGDRQYMLVLLGLNTGLRISDLLKLKVGEFRDRDRLMIAEKKTGKHSEILLHPSVLADVRRMTKGRSSDELLFASTHADQHGKAISYVTAYRWVKEACRRAGIERYAGCHTLRKTFGYMNYQKYRNVALLMKRFNHSGQDVTLHYIGVDQTEMDKLSENLL